MKTGREENDESDSSNTSGMQQGSAEETVSVSNGQVGSDGNNEIVIDLQSPAEYETETNNNDCKFYKQSLAKQALAGVF